MFCIRLLQSFYSLPRELLLYWIVQILRLYLALLIGVCLRESPQRSGRKIFFKGMKMKRIFCMMSIMVLAFMQALGQGQGSGNGMPPGETVIGKVTAVSKDSLTVARQQGGESVTVKVSETTHVFKDRQPFKVADIKVDETVFARGELRDGVMQASSVAVLNPEMAQRFAGGAGGTRSRMMPGLGPEDMGKKFIVGEVKAINETKLTIARPDGQTQEIEVDENTSFKKDNQSITLPDIKVGDSVRGRGELKGAVFVPKELIVGGRQMRMMGAPNSQPQEQKKPDSTLPSGAEPAATPK